MGRGVAAERFIESTLHTGIADLPKVIDLLLLHANPKKRGRLQSLL